MATEQKQSPAEKEFRRLIKKAGDTMRCAEQPGRYTLPLFGAKGKVFIYIGGSLVHTSRWEHLSTWEEALLQLKEWYRRRCPDKFTPEELK